MTREEMMARGLVPEETKHNGHRRAHFHDYNRPGFYMITLVTEGRQRLFGSIVGHTRGQKGTEDYPHLQCSVLGKRIMQRRLHLWIHDREYAAFGNLFLLKDPEKLQVFFHRRHPTNSKED